MDRRGLLKSIMSSAGLAAVGTTQGKSGAAAPTDGRARVQGKHLIEVRDGTKLFYKDWGTGQPVIFLPAWALNSDYWEYQMSFLAGRGVRCVGYDRRGHGRSSQPGQGYEFDTLADDLATVIDALDLRDVTLVGHAMGCGEVVRYLSRHGARRISRVVLIATITPCLLKTENNPDGVVERGAIEAARAALSRDRPRWLSGGGTEFYGPQNTVSSEILEWGTRLILQSSLKGGVLHRRWQ